MSFSSKIKDIRAQKGLSQSEFADLLGASQRAVSAWESGKTTPPMKKIEGIAETLGVDAGTLTGTTLATPRVVEFLLASVRAGNFTNEHLQIIRDEVQKMIDSGE